MTELEAFPPAVAVAVAEPVSVSPPTPGRHERAFSLFLWLYVPVAWLLLLTLPATPPTDTLDGSWQAVLHYAATRRWQAGVDVVLTYGPLGYLQYAGIYTGGTFVACIVYQLLAKAFYVGLVTHLARRLPLWGAVTFLLLNTFLPLLDEDTLYLLAIGYGGVVLEGSTRADRWWAVPTLAFLAAAALMKAVFLVYAGFVVACVAASLFASARPRRYSITVGGLDSFLVIGGFAGSFLLLYVWAGAQDLANLPPYLRNSWEVVAGHGAAMATFPRNPEGWFIAAAVLGVAGWRLGRAALAGGWRFHRWSALLICAAGLFIAWRQGFTRADPNHQITFFVYATCVASAASLFFPTTAGAARLCCLEALLAAVIIFQYQSRPIGERFTLAQRVGANCHWLFTPAGARAHLETLAAQAAERDALPRCRAAIGGANVDLFGCAQTVLLRNGFDYRPAPVVQPYCVYTGRLMELNAAFYRSERAPEFVLFNPYVIDRRFPNLENAPVLVWLLRHYQPVLAEREFLLLRRRRATSTAGAGDDIGQPLVEGELRPGEKLVLPPVDGPVWCELDWQPTLAGKLAGLVFQPPYCGLDVFAPDEDPPVACRLIPAMARAGFLLTPVVDSPQDFVRALAGRAEGQRVAAIRVEAGPAASLMQGTAHYRLRRLPPFPALTPPPADPR